MSDFKALLPLLMLLSGCPAPRQPSYYSYSSELQQEDRDKAAAFVVACASAANPRSDEEGEDLVEQCEQTAMSMFMIRHRTRWIDAEERYVRCASLEGTPNACAPE
jgi:hypothetical protein